MSEERLDGLLSLADVAGDQPLGDPDEEGLAELRELGKALANGLYQSLRILAIHSSENEAVNEPLRRLSAALRSLFTHSSAVHFITVEGQIYLNDLRIKMDASAYSNMVYLLTQLDKHGIGGITFSGAPSESDLKRLVQLLLQTKPPARDSDVAPLDNLRAALLESGLQGFTFDRPYYFKAGDSAAITQDSAEARQEVAALSYAKGVLAVKDYFRAVEAAEAANPLRIRKIVHDLVDVAEEEPENFLKLHTIQGVEEAYYNHCVNVTTLAVAIGKQLQLTRVQLADLGAAAMFHDLGYSALERQEAEEDREFSPADRMRLHPVAGFRSLLKQAEFGPGLLRRLLVVLEHHMTWERPGGYPTLGKKKLSVFTRIVQVADHYDALVTASDGQPGLLPVKALERIVHGSGTHFDPIVVRAFVQVVGRYPYGSLVKLSTGEVGVVTCGGRDEQRFSRPTVMIVRAGDGGEVDPFQVDLSERDVLRRRISAVLNPHDADLTPHAVLFDQLDVDEQEEVEETGPTGVDLEAWNRAIWEGEDIESVITDSMAAVVTGRSAITTESRPTVGDMGDESREELGLASHPLPEEDGQPFETLQPFEPLLDERDLATEPAPATEDVLAWLDAAITASQPKPEEPGDRAEPEAAPDATAPEPPSAPSSEALAPAVRNRLIAEAFMEGGEQAVRELMEQLSGADPTLK